MTTTDRIRELCKQKGMSLTKLEEMFHFGNGSLSKPNTKAMGSDRLFAIAQYFNVSMEYLMTGSEESQKNDFSHEELDLIRMFRTLSATNKEVIKATIKAMLEQEQITKKADLKSYKEA